MPQHVAQTAVAAADTALNLLSEVVSPHDAASASPTELVSAARAMLVAARACGAAVTKLTTATTAAPSH